MRIPAKKTAPRTVFEVILLLFLWPLSAGAEDGKDVRKELTHFGVTPRLSYDGDIYVNADGGLRRGATYVGNLRLELVVNGERLLSWPGATLFLEGLSIHGGRPTQFSGDGQTACNIEGPTRWYLEEAWIQQNFFQNRFSALFGIYDLNTEFYRLVSAGLFLNSSFGVGAEFAQSGIAGPSIFPRTSPGARFEVKPTEQFIFRAAVMDGSPLERPDGTYAGFLNGNGQLLVSEAAFLYRPVLENTPPRHRSRLGRFARIPAYQTKIAVGAWYYTARFPDLSATEPDGQPVRHRGNGGFYLLDDGVLYQNPEHPRRRVSAFAQLGFADPRMNRFDSYVGAGLVSAGLFPAREKDEVGVAVAMARNGSHYQEAQDLQGTPVKRSEVAVEFTYLLQVAKWIALQPDIQYIIHPNTDPSVKDALAFQLRFELSF